jgi:hypothetical protein
MTKSSRRRHIRMKVLQRRARRLWHKMFPREEYASYSIAPFSVRKRIVIVEWNSPEGRSMLQRSAHKEAFFRLAHNYQPQINPFYCSVASMVTALNTLRLHRGKVPSQHGFEFEMPDGTPITYRLYSQLTLLNDATEQIKKKVHIAPSLLPKGTPIDEESLNPGLDLHEVSAMLESHGAKSHLYYASLPPVHGLPKFCESMKLMLNDPSKVMIANFDGKTLGASTGGHYSLIGAYDAESDSVLVLDTAGHRNPWFWVPAKHLYFAMHTKPPKGNFYRGYLIVTDPEDAPR